MRKWLIAGVFMLSSLASAGEWSVAQIDSVFNTLYSDGAQAAIEEVNSNGATAYDFGLDLLAIGKTQESIAWYSAMILAVEDNHRYIFGKAWVQRETGDLQAAMLTANQILQRSENDLFRARAHYLLGTIHLMAGSKSYANAEFNSSLSLYSQLGLSGGISLCLKYLSVQKIDPTNIPFDPPRDDTDS